MRIVLKTRWIAAAAVALICASSQARLLPQQVVVTKTADSKTLTVRYSGAKASTAELRVNGKVVTSRSLSSDQSSGETNFTLDPTRLNEGENTIEVVLFDSNGRALASQKTEVTMNRADAGMVFVQKPKNGESLQGMVEISVGFKNEMKNSYVSFFINDEFKALKNYPPYTFLWDTNKVSNGWHEVEAWVVDENSATFKTERLRVFVNNPGGFTTRETTKVEAREAAKPAPPKVTPVATAAKPAPAALATSQNKVQANFSKPAGTKPVVLTSGTMTGMKVMRPTGSRVAGPKTAKTVATAPQATPAAPGVPTPGREAIVAVNVSKGTGVAKPAPANFAKTAAAPIKLSYGTRLPASGAYSISVNGSPVRFDVTPRIDGGVALTPFRHLFEHVGGKVAWENSSKTVKAKGQGADLWFQIGQDFATVNGGRVGLERRSFLESGRAIVPLSFVQDFLKVEVSYDPATKHVLVTKK